MKRWSMQRYLLQIARHTGSQALPERLSTQSLRTATIRPARCCQIQPPAAQRPRVFEAVARPQLHRRCARAGRHHRSGQRAGQVARSRHRRAAVPPPYARGCADAGGRRVASRRAPRARRDAPRRRPHPPRAGRRHAEPQRAERVPAALAAAAAGRVHAPAPEIEVRFGPSRAALDFSRDDFHAAILYGSGQWSGLKSERLLDEWVFPVCSPALLARLGPIDTLADFARYPLIHSRSEPWPDWLRRVGGDTTRADIAPADRGFGGDAGGRRTGQGRRARPLVAGGGGHRGRAAGAADAAERPAAQRLVPGGTARELLPAEGRAVPRLAGRVLPRIPAAHRRDAPRRVIPGGVCWRGPCKNG